MGDKHRENDGEQQAESKLAMWVNECVRTLISTASRVYTDACAFCLRMFYEGVWNVSD